MDILNAALAENSLPNSKYDTDDFIVQLVVETDNHIDEIMLKAEFNQWFFYNTLFGIGSHYYK